MSASVTSRPAISGRVGVACATAGTVIAAVLVVVADRAFATGAVPDDHLRTLLGFLVTWVPMLAAVGVFCWLRRRDRPGRTLGLRFTWIDLLWGVAIGILARCVASIVNLLLFGTTGLVGQPMLGSVDAWFIFGAAVAPVLLAPVIEEVFFRGLMLGSLVSWVGGVPARVRGPAQVLARVPARVPVRGPVRVPARSGSVADRAASDSRPGALVAAVAVTSVVFVGVHLIGVTSLYGAIAQAVPLLLFAIAVGATRLLTDRLGAAITAHIVFNGAAVLLTWPR